jgi:hypothetical protein
MNLRVGLAYLDLIPGWPHPAGQPMLLWPIELHKLSNNIVFIISAALQPVWRRLWSALITPVGWLTPGEIRSA